MTRRYRSLLLALIPTLAALVVPSAHAADEWPSRPVRIVVPFPAGGGFDTIARPLSEHLTKKFGQSFVVDNKAGAVGTIGSALVAKADPDGYTLLLSGAGPLVTGPMTLKAQPYDSTKDFTHIILMAVQPNIIVVPADSPYKNLKEFIAFLKANPNKLNYGSSGIGAQGHLAAELFQKDTGTQLNHIPYKGSGLAVNDLLAGHIKVNFDTISAYIGHIQSGKLRGLMVSSRERVPVLPTVPTATEAGLTNFETAAWYALSAPAGLPAPIVAKLNAAANEFLSSPEVTQRLEKAAMLKRGGTAAQFDAYVKSEIVKWGPIVKAAGITAN